MDDDDLYSFIKFLYDGKIIYVILNSKHINYFKIFAYTVNLASIIISFKFNECYIFVYKIMWC